MTEEWRLFTNACSQADRINFPVWKSFVSEWDKMCHRELGTIYLNGRSILIEKIANVSTYPDYWSYCGLFPRDAKFIENEWCSVEREGFEDPPDPGSLNDHIKIEKRTGWFSGTFQQGLHILCDLGIPPSAWRINESLIDAMNIRPIRAGSISELCDIICRIYEGQFILFKVSEDGNELLANTAAAGPCGRACLLADQELRETLYRDWRANLKKRHVYNLVSFRGS
jgi:hypothetical protein